MNTRKRSCSSYDLNVSKLNIIESFLDQNVPTLKSSKTTIFQVSFVKINQAPKNKCFNTFELIHEHVQI